MTKSNTIKKSTGEGVDDPNQLLVLAEYKRLWGNVSLACAEAGISRTTFYRWKDANPNFKDAVDEIEASHIDHAKARLKELAIKDGNVTALIFFLKNKAPDEFRDRQVYEGEVRLGLTGLEHLSNQDLERLIRLTKEER